MESHFKPTKKQTGFNCVVLTVYFSWQRDSAADSASDVTTGSEGALSVWCVSEARLHGDALGLWSCWVHLNEESWEWLSFMNKPFYSSFFSMYVTKETRETSCRMHWTIESYNTFSINLFEHLMSLSCVWVHLCRSWEKAMKTTGTDLEDCHWLLLIFTICFLRHSSVHCLFLFSLLHLFPLNLPERK